MHCFDCFQSHRCRLDDQLDEIEHNPPQLQKAIYAVSTGPVGKATATGVQVRRAHDVAQWFIFVCVGGGGRAGLCAGSAHTGWAPPLACWQAAARAAALRRGRCCILCGAFSRVAGPAMHGAHLLLPAYLLAQSFALWLAAALPLPLHTLLHGCLPKELSQLQQFPATVAAPMYVAAPH